MIRVLVADDNAVVRSGVTSLLEASGRVRTVAQASTGKEALTLARAHRPDVVLLDVRMPVMDGLTAAAPLSELAKVLMLTYSEEPEIVTTAIRAGACGYLVHNRFTPDELVKAVEDVAAGRSVLSPAVTPAVFDALKVAPAASQTTAAANGLTEREGEIMNLIAQGHANTAVAHTLFLSEKTVKNHLNRIYAKLGVTTRAEAIATWLGTRH